jgi:hypothetical protein
MDKMQLCATNSDNHPIFAAISFQLVSSEREVRSQQKNLYASKERPIDGWLRTVEAAIGIEFSMVPEVENVFVQSDKDNGKAYRVITIINERDPDVRAKVYRSEQRVMDAFKGIEFSFRVIARANRNLPEVIDSVGRLAYQKR